MRTKMWSSVLAVLSFLPLTVLADPPSHPREPGTRVTIRLAESSGQLPDAEKLVESLLSAGGDHRVRAKRRQKEGQQELTLDLWGGTVPQAEIPQSLRNAFPVLVPAVIQVAAIDPRDRPGHEDLDDDLEREGHGDKKVIKKVVKIIKKE
jgi:hypothetical protein